MTHACFPRKVDLATMSETLRNTSEFDASQPAEWNFPLIATSTDDAERISRYLSGAILACGGWILTRAVAGEHCAEISFEFPRANCVEIYSVLIASGLTLSQEAHIKLTELCQCTLYLLASKSLEVVRLQLTVYTRAASGREDALVPLPETAAA